MSVKASEITGQFATWHYQEHVCILIDILLEFGLKFPIDKAVASIDVDWDAWRDMASSDDKSFCKFK